MRISTWAVDMQKLKEKTVQRLRNCGGSFVSEPVLKTRVKRLLVPEHQSRHPHADLLRRSLVLVCYPESRVSLGLVEDNVLSLDKNIS
jgi:hypothetical protein